MPRLRTTPSKYDKLIVCITGYADLRGITLATAMGVTYKTAITKKQNPEKLTLGEISTIGRTLGIPIEELRSCIPY